MKLDKLADLKQKITAKSSKAEQAKGALKEKMQRLADEFGVDSLKEAKEALAKMKIEHEEAEEERDEAYVLFMAEWGDLLDE